MAIEHADNFTAYAAAANMLDGVYAQIINDVYVLASPDPTDAGKPVMKTTSGYGPAGPVGVRRVLKTATDTLGFAARVWHHGLPPNNAQGFYFSWRNDANGEELFVTTSSTGTIRAFCGVTLLGESVPVLTANAFHHIEAKAYVHNINGSVEVRVNGVPVLSVAGVKTSNSGSVSPTVIAQTYHGSRIEGTGATTYTSWKDFVLWNGLGARNNDFMGSVEVFSIVPESDVAFPWTPSTGATGFDMVNDNSDADYISAPYPPPAYSEFTLTDLPEEVTSVRGIVVLSRLRKTDGGDAQAQVGLTDGVNISQGLDRPITTAYTFWADVFETAPDGTSWTKAKADATQIRVNRTL